MHPEWETHSLLCTCAGDAAPCLRSGAPLVCICLSHVVRASCFHQSVLTPSTVVGTVSLPVLSWIPCHRGHQEQRKGKGQKPNVVGLDRRTEVLNLAFHDHGPEQPH